MAVERNITTDDHWFVGEDKALVFTIYQSDGTTAQDISGWTLSWRFKRQRSDLDAASLLVKTTSDGIALTTPASGVCTVTVTDADTDALTALRGYHELKRTTDGSETVLTYGKCVLQRGVHRT